MQPLQSYHPPPQGGGKSPANGLFIIISLLVTILFSPWLHEILFPLGAGILEKVYGQATLKFWEGAFLVLTYPLCFMIVRGMLSGFFLVTLLKLMQRYL